MLLRRVPAELEMPADIPDHRSFDADIHVMPGLFRVAVMTGVVKPPRIDIQPADDAMRVVRDQELLMKCSQ